ncbi:MAG: hypothetical protein M3256_12440 [Actinomycetota bacterium]|nr:hypothetical protein [Actinomycetota bacterium]
MPAAIPDAPLGAVATAALAAFRSALGEGDSVLGEGNSVLGESRPLATAAPSVKPRAHVDDGALTGATDAEANPAPEGDNPAAEAAVIEAAVIDEASCDEAREAGGHLEDPADARHPFDGPIPGEGASPLAWLLRRRRQTTGTSTVAPDGAAQQLDDMAAADDPEPMDSPLPARNGIEAPGPGVVEPSSDAVTPMATTTHASTGAADPEWPIDEWGPDETAWAALAADDTPPAFAAPLADADVVDRAGAGDPLHAAPIPPTVVAASHRLDHGEPATPAKGLDAVAVQSDPTAEGGRPPVPRWEGPGCLKPKVLAGATAAVLAAGIIAAMIVHPKEIPRFETVNLRGGGGQSLFPGAASPSTVTAPNSNSLIVIPPGPLVSTPLPGAVPVPTSAGPTTTVNPTTTSTPQPAPPGRSGQRSGGSSPPPASPPPRNTPTPPRPAPPTTAKQTTTVPTTTCPLGFHLLLGVCLPA